MSEDAALSRTAVLRQVNEVLAAVVDKSDLVVDEDTTAGDVQGWDSLAHTTFIAAVEKRFAVKFTLREVMRFKNIGDLCTLVCSKLGL